MVETLHSRRLVRFADFEVDLQTGELRRGGVRLKLTGQPFQVLAILLECPGEVVMREELQKRLWPDTFVDVDHNLNTAINKIREVLGDSAENPRYVETLARRGYRFVAPILEPKPIVKEAQSTTVEAPPGPSPSLRKPKTWLMTLSLSSLIAVAVLAGAAVVLFVADVGGVRSKLLSRHSAQPQIRSLAVLPLANLSGDPQQEYFADGMTDALISELGKIGSLRVISRTSVMQYKETKKTVPQIARELNVDAVVEGSVLRAGDRVRISAELIAAAPERQLWAHNYGRDLRDALSLQGEIARAIADEVQAHITPREQSRLTANRKTNTRAYDAYLRGRYLWNQRNAEAITKALGYFQQAVRDDPEFALGYSGLADCYWVGWGFENDFKKAEEYARKALSLEPDLAEAHVSLGISSLYQYDLTVADSELSRALESNPNYAMAHHAHAAYLLGIGRATNALEENDRARQLDPFSIPINTFRTVILIGLRRYQEAADQVRMTLELAPRAAVIHNLESRIYWLQGKPLEAIAAQRQAGSLAPAPQIVRDQDEVAAAFEKAGLRAAQLKAAQLMEKDGVEAQFGPIVIALQYGTIENRAKALYWLEKSFRAQEGNLLIMAKTAPEFDFLRSDAQFQALLNRLGVPLT